MYTSTPKELHADLVNADEAACEARPPAVLTTAVPVAQRLHIDVRFAPKAPTDLEMDRIIEDASAHGAGIVVISKVRKGENERVVGKPSTAAARCLPPTQRTP